MGMLLFFDAVMMFRFDFEKMNFNYVFCLMVCFVAVLSMFQTLFPLRLIGK